VLQQFGSPLLSHDVLIFLTMAVYVSRSFGKTSGLCIHARRQFVAEQVLWDRQQYYLQCARGSRVIAGDQSIYYT